MPVQRRFHALFLFAFLAACFAAPARSEDRLPDAVAQALASAGIPAAAVAIVVRDAAPGGETELAFNAMAAFNPASVMKLLTTYAALELLGPAYTWSTEARAASPVVDGRLAGDLYLKGDGDPKLTLEQLWRLLRDLRARGIRDIAGDLVLDRSRFAVDDASPQFDDQPRRAYNVAPDALLVNFNAIRLQLVPDAGRKRLVVIVEPLPEGLDVVNLARLTGGPCGDWRERLRLDASERDGRTRLIVSGSYAEACGEKNWNVSVMAHPRFVLGVFRTLWRELGGTLGGGLREGATPADARLIAAIESPTLGEAVRDINKFSNNVMARQLFLTLGAEASGRQGATTADGDAAVRVWLHRKGMQFPELVLENGSGLSRRERISAASLARLMEAAWASPLMPEFVASLPLAAIDGTMKKRLNGGTAAGQAHIKTGSLEGVKTIAGYVRDRAGHWRIVVFLINHANARLGQPAQDALLQWVYQRGS